MKNVFEKIINGELPADKVYETDSVLAFMDINPNVKGHTLVIPKKSIENIFELEGTDAGDLMEAIVKVSNAVKKATGAKGVNISSNNGKEAGQVVFHLHFHVIPRFDKSEFGSLPHQDYKDGEMRDFADRIRKEL